MTENEIDNECMDRIKAGVESGLEDLMDRYSRMIRGFYFQKSIQRDVREELLQDVFLKVWSKASQFRSGAVFRMWLFGIARNAMLDRVRKDRRLKRETALSQLSFYGNDGSVCDGNTSLRDVEDSSLSESVDIEHMLCVAGRLLSAGEMQAFEDTVSGLDTSEMAEKRGVDASTCRWRRMHALKSLRNSNEFAREFSPAFV